ncbi:uncharacterized protein EDB91DRAFT_1097048 [Suillus paluster]|uniref:uncharacterized protein n=1 Tax=Suillus paluster TaxID=48578 RepID=UPI001B8639E7|nr:uncharacterized protein EDB91DRAFT_1097048 [Suillus paluster]KAG1755055.1 hypothetical protein EDB91DRAFT_1097048 [Suillus paluster]
MLSYESVCLLAYVWFYALSVWVSFYGGFIALRTLPRQQFGALQHKYFTFSTIFASALLGVWTWAHPALLSHLASPFKRPDVAQAYVLASVVALQVCNQFVVGPMTSRTMSQQHKLEKEEGENCNDTEVSDRMKALHAKFRMLRRISSLANVGAFIALTFHGLWIGSYLVAIRNLY